MVSKKLEHHLKNEHRISPFQTYLREIVYGGNDGIVTTFAVVAGFSGANLATRLPEYSFLTVLLFGLANLFADGVSMGLGNFLSLRANQDVYNAERAKELHEIDNDPLSEKEETMLILQEKGFTEKQAKELTTLYATNKDYWADFMMQYELELPNTTSENPLYTGLATFTAFLAFGAIPLVPFMLNSSPDRAFFYSISATVIALLLLGILRWKVTREKLVRSVMEILLVGSTAAAVAYVVGTLFTV